MARDKDPKYYWKQDRHGGGEAEDARIDGEGAYRYVVGADIRRDSGVLYVAKKPVAEDISAITVDAPIKWFEINPSNNDVYMYGGTKIFKESGGTYSLARTLSSGTPNGEGLQHFNGKLYYRWDDKLGHFDYASTWTDSWQTGLEVVDFSPMCRFKNYLLVGHGRYVGVVDDLGTWDADRIVLPPNYVVRSIFRAGSLAVILADYGSSIFNSEEGMAFLWDGTSQQYNAFFPIDGNPHAGIYHHNKIIIIAGQQPDIIESLGGIGQVVKSIPNVGDGKTAEVWPGAIDIWQKMIHFGISDGTSTTVLRVVRNWGARNARFPDVLNPEFPVTTGTLTGTSLQITALKRIGTTIRYAFKEGSTYYIAEVDTTQYQSVARVRTLAFDNASPFEKLAFKLNVELAGALKTDESVVIKINGDPYDDPTFGGSDTITRTESTVGKTLCTFPFTADAQEVRSRDIHLEVALNGPGTTAPAMKRFWVELEDQEDTL